jgi:hypothetical protein
MITEFDRAVLTVDLPDRGFRAGDVGTVVDVLADGRAYIVEFMTMDGDTLDVVVLTSDQVRPVGESDMPHVRTLSTPSASD